MCWFTRVFIFLVFFEINLINAYVGDYGRYFWNSKDVQPDYSVFDYRYYLPNGYEFSSSPVYEVNINSVPKEWLRGDVNINSIPKEWLRGEVQHKKLPKPSELAEVLTAEGMTNNQMPAAIPDNTEKNYTAPNDPRCKRNRGAFPIQNSCSSYINCWDGQSEIQECPGDLLFSEFEFCDYPQRVNCGGRPIDLRRPGCHYPYLAYRHPNNCSEFFMCAHQLYYLFRCPDDLQFNENIGVCDYPYRVNCQNPPHAAFRFPPPPMTSRPLVGSGYVTNSLPGQPNFSSRPNQNNYPFYYQNVWNINSRQASSRQDALRQLDLDKLEGESNGDGNQTL